MSEITKAVNLVTAENLEGRINVAQALGSSSTAMYVYDLDPGDGSCPYHYEYEEEWLLVLEGEVAVRTPDGEQRLTRGDLVRFAKGPTGAHKVTNRDERAAQVLMFSSAHEPSVAVYPDSDKIGVWSGNDADKVMLRRGDGNVDYYDGER